MPRVKIPNDPEFSHYVVEGDYIIGEARDVKIDSYGPGISFAFVRLFGMEDFAEYGSIENRNLLPKYRAKLP